MDALARVRVSVDVSATSPLACLEDRGGLSPRPGAVAGAVLVGCVELGGKGLLALLGAAMMLGALVAAVIGQLAPVLAAGGRAAMEAAKGGCSCGGE